MMQKRKKKKKRRREAQSVHYAIFTASSCLDRSPDSPLISSTPTSGDTSGVKVS